MMDFSYKRMSNFLRFIMIGLFFGLPVAACMGCAQSCTRDAELDVVRDMTGRYGDLVLVQSIEPMTLENCRVVFHQPRVMQWYVTCGTNGDYEEFSFQGQVLFKPNSTANRISRQRHQPQGRLAQTYQTWPNKEN